MANCNYITVIEIGSSKISGAVATMTYSGIQICAYASTPTDGFVSKGIVRNVDEFGIIISNLVNCLEGQLKNLMIEKAYVALGGLSLRSVRSCVERSYDEHRKITQEILNELALENDATFKVPAGYRKVRTMAPEYRLNGEANITPIGVPTCHIECFYQNIVMREQYVAQLEESLAIARIEVAEFVIAPQVEAEILLTEDEMSSGTALVNIGADTSTVSLFSSKSLRKIAVVPLGSSNITKDLCTKHISQKEAEQLKIFKGYYSQSGDCEIPCEVVDDIIAARMSEILLNVRHQIEISGENIGHIVFTGGGSKLKNLDMLIKDNLPNMNCRISDFDAQDIESLIPLAKGSITPLLYAVLGGEGENCCVAPSVQEALFSPEEMPEIPAIHPNDATKTNDVVDDVPKEHITETKKPETKKPEKKAGKIDKIKSFLEDWFDNATAEEDDNGRLDRDDE